MKITFIRSNTNAVGEYRVKHPFLALSAMGHQCNLLTLNQKATRVANTELASDVLVLQRQTSLDCIQLRDTLPYRPVTVFEIDDNPWEWHSWDSIHAELGRNYGECVRRVMAHCDAVTCSTPTLAARIRREFPEMPIWVVPNAIDFNIRDWKAKENRAEHNLTDRVVLGWTGSIHHTRDGQELLQALPAVFEAFPNVVFLMQCDRSVYYAWTTPLVNKYRDQLRWVPPLPFDVHPMIYSLFDVNLAPLERTPFNTCKSDLRLIEGGAHGVPYVASKLAPYQEFDRISGGIGGLLASGTRGWFDAIVEILDQREARGQSLRRYVEATRALDVVAPQWETAFLGALAKQEGEEVGAAGVPTRNTPCPCGSEEKYKRCCAPAYG
jgi:SEC-C motif-containing protein